MAIQQLIAIARALEDDTRVLVLDEPTASLDANETELLFGIMRDLKARGIAIVFITHFIDQVYQIADRISVLRNGRLVGTAATADLPPLKLISMMLGRELEQTEERLVSSASAAKGEPIVVAEGLGRRRLMAPFDLSIRPGEVVGLAGLLGSGRTEVAKLIFGAVRPDSGRLSVGGASDDDRIRRDARCGRAWRSVRKTARPRASSSNSPCARTSSWRCRASAAGCGGCRTTSRRSSPQKMIKALAIATPDADKPVGQLSGGNQQKVVLARALVSDPRILILDEPTRGIDVGAHAEIVALIRRLCDAGPRAAGGVVGARRARRRQRPDRGAARPAEDRRDRRARDHPRERHPHDRGGESVKHSADIEAEAPSASRLRAIARASRDLAARRAGAHLRRRRIISPGFFHIRIVEGRLFGNLIDILYRAMPTAIVALGMAVVIGTKGIDLSVGSIIAIVGAVITWRIHAGDPHFVILLIALGVGPPVRPLERLPGRDPRHPADHRDPDPDGVRPRHRADDQSPLRGHQSELHQPACSRASASAISASSRPGSSSASRSSACSGC